MNFVHWCHLCQKYQLLLRISHFLSSTLKLKGISVRFAPNKEYLHPSYNNDKVTVPSLGHRGSQNPIIL